MTLSERFLLLFSLSLTLSVATSDTACAARTAAMALSGIPADAPFAPAPAQPDTDSSTWASVDHYSVRPIFYSARQQTGFFLVTDPGARVAGEAIKAPRFTVGICQLASQSFEVNYETKIELKMSDCHDINSKWAPSTSKNVSAFNERWRADLNVKYESMAKSALSRGSFAKTMMNSAVRAALIEWGVNGLLTYPGFSGSLAMAGGSSEGFNLDAPPTPFPVELLSTIFDMAKESFAQTLTNSATASTGDSDKAPEPGKAG